MLYKCNNFGHIDQNFHAPVDQQNPRSRTLVSQLCNNFKHIPKYFRMDRNLGDRRNNRRNFKNRRNDGRNFRNDRRNNERNSKTKKDNEEQRNIVSKLQEELNEAFIKGLNILEEKLEYRETGRSKLAIEFDSTQLN